MGCSFYCILRENNFPNWCSNLTFPADQTLEWYTEGLLRGAEAKNCEAVQRERERERERVREREVQE